MDMMTQLKNLMLHARATWVLWILVALSIASLAIALDRARAFWAGRDDLSRLVRDLHALLGASDLTGAESRLRASRSVEAAIVAAGLAQWERGPTSVDEAMKAATGLERARLERRLGFLGTVGSNAPFVGLLGTVIGIVAAFEALGTTSPGAADLLAPEQVMSAIAEALIATALGLAVAIPAVAAFNYFQGLLASTLSNAETLGHVLLTHVSGVAHRGEAEHSSRRELAPDRVLLTEHASEAQ